MAKPKRPRDPNQLAKLIVDLSTGDTSEADPDAGKDPEAIKRGRLGGIKGGRSRAKSLSPTKRRKIARKAAASRWSGG
ncbi:MAG: histone H1 [Betaproteobacteria bacterium]|nr:MAG: histone H1 [Betaproteobacteria bacterium]